MPRGIWKGHISFGLVNIPVTLHPAEAREELDLDLLDERDFSPIGYLKVNKRTGREVPKTEIVRGFQYENGKYVVVTDEDLKRASPERAQRVDIRSFTDAHEIDPRFYDRPYYLEPAPKQGKPYALLREALKKTGKVGIATVVIRTRQHLAALIPLESVLVLNVLRYADELRNPDALDLPRNSLKALGISENELKMAERLIEEMVLAYVKKKAERGETETVEEPEKPRRPRGEVIDIMSLLKQSVQEAGGTRKRSRRKTA